MNIEDLAKEELKIEHSMAFKPEYLQAIGMIAVEINSLESMLAVLLGHMLNVSKETALGLYFAPNAMAVRFSLLEAATLELPAGHKKKIGGLIGRAKGIMTRRHEIVHEFWFHDQTNDAVHRVAMKKSAQVKSKPPVPIGVLNHLTRDIKNAILETAVSIALVSIDRQAKQKKS